MTKSKWRFNIYEDIKNNGNYKPSFDRVIDTLAQVLEHRDKIMQQFKDSGEEYVVKGRKNPQIVLWDDLNKTALAYFRELGLTVASLNRIDEGAVKQPKQNKLEEMIKKLEA